MSRGTAGFDIVTAITQDTINLQFDQLFRIGRIPRRLALDVADTAVILNTGRCVFAGQAGRLQTDEQLIAQNLGVYHAH